MPAVSMKLANSATAAMTADPMAKPFVTALVVFPTASSETMIRSGSPWNSPDISAMPAALSEIGPKVSSDTMTPVVASMPMPVERDEVERELQVAAAERERDAERDGDGDDGVHRRLEPRRGAGQHDRGRAGAGRLGDLAHGCVVRRREVLGEPADGLREHEADDHGTEAAQADVGERCFAVALHTVADVQAGRAARRR